METVSHPTNTITPHRHHGKNRGNPENIGANKGMLKYQHGGLLGVHDTLSSEIETDFC